MACIRKPNFDKDLEIGKIGENLLREILEKSKKTVNIDDVSDDYRFKLLDVDFIQYTKKKEDGTDYNSDDVFYSFIGKDKDRTFRTTYEVKTDTRSLASRNVVFEVISHDGPGCAALSRADYFFYVFTDDNKDIREAWLINMKKWRKFIRENSKSPKNLSETKNGGFALHNFDTYGDHVLNFLTNIGVLEKEKIAININIREYA